MFFFPDLCQNSISDTGQKKGLFHPDSVDAIPGALQKICDYEFCIVKSPHLHVCSVPVDLACD